ncbi:uncharacterized protein K452DRAFT_311977 [Aplosporella prunicola CBS 121167]|uniref:Uncharacterized protein n=1 Tax=Aplosporella prunicola CBS 121167 TaxID=1176127 RepID=A0A6A6B0Z7_9PEZI|nr:uncharacterized protein K452DRAFT_311977 [Aplosporella prunicola CBS 121167]KAF2137839.1 hypothetical protein K452DRAFT_311977 [Aplosporella prunicola CBS 121167]
MTKAVSVYGLPTQPRPWPCKELPNIQPRLMGNLGRGHEPLGLLPGKEQRSVRRSLSMLYAGASTTRIYHMPPAPDPTNPGSNHLQISTWIWKTMIYPKILLEQRRYTPIPTNKANDHQFAWLYARNTQQQHFSQPLKPQRPQSFQKSNNKPIVARQSNPESIKSSKQNRQRQSAATEVSQILSDPELLLSYRIHVNTATR